jgi:hypothetical protein
MDDKTSQFTIQKDKFINIVGDAFASKIIEEMNK